MSTPNRRDNFMKLTSLGAVLLMLVGCALCGVTVTEEKTGPPYQANGVKIGEVTQTSAIIWTRLTEKPERNTDGIPFAKTKKLKNEKGELLPPPPVLPIGARLYQMKNAVPGMMGQTRIVYWTVGKEDQKIETPWMTVNPKRDFTRQFVLTDLQPSTGHSFEVECRPDASTNTGQKVKGRFKTAPSPDDPARVVFTVVTGQQFNDFSDSAKQYGPKIYPAMTKLQPSFFVHTGDIVYHDSRAPLAATIDLARFKYKRIYALPRLRDFHNNIPSYFIKDDHDTWTNNCWPTMEDHEMGDFTFVQGQAVFLEQVPMGDLTYRTVRWGKDLQIWLVEGRDYRSPNNMPDGPEKTIWGRKQKEWFKRTVQQSDATFRVLISPTPLVGPDRGDDNHANEPWSYEGNELRQFTAKQKNMIVVCGDRHWQYVSVDDETGLREYSCGPVTDEHAKKPGTVDREPEHRYLSLCGGFLSGTVERINGTPTLTFRHHDVDGKVLYEDRLKSEP